MATMTDAPYVTHVPVLTGGHGRDEVRQLYATWFVGHWPADMQGTQSHAPRGRAGGSTSPSPPSRTTWRCRPCGPALRRQVAKCHWPTSWGWVLWTGEVR